MRILINASNLKVGGGLQVADSVIHELKNNPLHSYVVVVSSRLAEACRDLDCGNVVDVIEYDLPHSILMALTGRDSFLDKLVGKYQIDAVLTIFGSSRWRPRRPHLCGFARAHIVIPESPYWKRLKGIPRLKSIARRILDRLLFNISAPNLWSENSFISSRLKKLWPNKKIYTITNNYNQVFDDAQLWDNSISLPKFDGVTLLTVSANYPHKNLDIIRPCVAWLKTNWPDLKFRFVLSLTEDQYPLFTDDEREHIFLIGSVNINQVPHLYEQSDVMFLPTLLECFSASYTEAMKMKVPILTTDLGFAHSICSEAACYYQATSAADLGEKIVKMVNNKTYCKQLIAAGISRLSYFDTAATRAQKLINITASLAISESMDYKHKK